MSLITRAPTGGLFGKTQAALSETDYQDFIDRELHLTLKEKQEKSLAKAMMKPDEWLTDRHNEFPAIRDGVAAAYKKYYDSFYAEGYSAEEAQVKASRIAQNILDIEMEELEMRMPGAATIFKGAANEKNHRDNRLAGALGGYETDKEIYKRIRRKKKAKKANQ